MFFSRKPYKSPSAILSINLHSFASLEDLDAFVRLRFFQIITGLFSLYACFYAFLNLFRGDSFKLSVNISILLYLVFLNALLLKKRDIDLAVLLALPMFLLLELFFIYALPARNTGIVWIYAFLLFLLYIGSPRIGFFASFLSFAILSGATLLDLFAVTKTGYTQEGWLKIIFVHTIIQTFSYLFSKRHLLLIRFFEKQYYTDSLTGLPNRSCLERDLLGHPRSWLFLVDIIGFSEINSFYGRHIGNALLISYAKKLQELLKHTNLRPYRFFADIFAIIDTGDMEDAKYTDSQAHSQRKAKNSIQHILEKLEQTEFPCGKSKISLQLLSGISNTPNNKMETAEAALRAAHATNHKILFYSPKIDKSSFYESNLKALDFINQALQNNKVLTYFQPIYHTQTAKVHHAEALMRFVDTKGRAHSPFPYLTVAKKANLYPVLSQIMLKNTAEFISTYKIPCSINIADTDLHHIDFLFKNIEEFFSAKTSPLLGFELLEDNALQEAQASTALFDFAKKRGSKIAIDDFGAGYSNFRRLMDLKLDYLKIDGSLIQNLDHDKKSKAVVSTIVNYAESCGLATIAEFVHSKEIAKAVREMGISYSQGFYLGRPVAFSEFRQFL